MKTDKQIIRRVLKKLKTRARLKSGLCLFSAQMEIKGELTDEEQTRFIEIIYKYKPKYCPLSGYYFFPPNERKPRIEFLQDILKNY